MKNEHEIRDPLYAFIKMTSAERNIIDSIPFQRLRHIHQLALTNLIYPGATHKRFGHSLGTMELAARVFDTVTKECNIHPAVRELGIIPQDKYLFERSRLQLRMAALCHDLGHLPFSHAAEKELLPAGHTHETMTKAIIESDFIKPLWDVMKIDAVDISKIAVGPKKSGENFSTWEAILSEIITGDAFGMDRVDYLLRDSYYAGVMYGNVDYFRLIDTMRILPKQYEQSLEAALGIEDGGIHLVENLLLSRYFMYTQVYFHPIRKIYDLHLQDFMISLYPGQTFPSDVKSFLSLTDNEIFVKLRETLDDKKNPGHVLSKRILCRQHFKCIYAGKYKDKEKLENLFAELAKLFGKDKIKKYSEYDKDDPYQFPVLQKNHRVVTSDKVSAMIESKAIPKVSVFYIYADREICEKARKQVREFLKKEKI